MAELCNGVPQWVVVRARELGDGTDLRIGIDSPALPSQKLICFRPSRRRVLPSLPSPPSPQEAFSVRGMPPETVPAHTHSYDVRTQTPVGSHVLSTADEVAQAVRSRAQFGVGHD